MRSLGHPILLNATDAICDCAAERSDAHSELWAKLGLAAIASAVLGVSGGCVAFMAKRSATDSPILQCEWRSTALSEVAKNGVSLKHFPEFQDDREVVMAGVRTDGLAL